MITSLSFRPTPRFSDAPKMGGLGPVNVLVGPNGSGKSTLLQLLLSFPASVEDFSASSTSLRSQVADRIVRLGVTQSNSTPLLKHPLLLPPELKFNVSDGKAILEEGLARALVDGVSARWEDVWLGNSHQGDAEEMKRRVSRAIQAAAGEAIRKPSFFFIPAVRSRKEDFASILSAADLSARLRVLQESEDESGLEQLRASLEWFHPMFRTHRLEAAALSGSDQLVMLNLRTHRKVRVSDLGDGFNNALTIAAPIALDALKGDDLLVLFEEPEVHLHPPMWRALLNFVRSLTTQDKAQLFVTTHSSSVMEYLGRASFFYTQQADAGSPGGCEVRSASDLLRLAGMTPEISARPCNSSALGHLMLGGLVLLVEGPSDQILCARILADLGRPDVLPVNIHGDFQATLHVPKLNGLFPGRVVGLVDASRVKAGVSTPGVHVLEHTKIEKYLRKNGNPITGSINKLAIAHLAAEELDGYSITPALTSEVEAALQLYGGADTAS